MASLRGLHHLGANGLAALSFLVFAFAVLSLHQERSIPFAIEETGPIPVALSHVLFGAPRGLVDSGMSNFFWRDVLGIPAEEAVERALTRGIAQAHDLGPMPDGNGIGAIVMVRAAFALFGVHAHALSYFFVLLLGLSAGAFIFRYQDSRIFAVPVLFTAFTALLLTPMITPYVAIQAPIGGVRSYAIIGILAALHWCFELAVDRTDFRLGNGIRWVLLGIQIAILGLAILVRGSPIYLLGPVVVVAIYHLRRLWGEPGMSATLLRLAIPAVALIAIPASIAPLVFPEYAQAGKARTVVWHRVFVSFTLHPEWPFAGLRHTYPCPNIPEGLSIAAGDRNGHCVWLDYASGHGLSDGQAIDRVYGSEYEAALRAAVWQVVRTYPKEAFETFFYYKPKQVLDTIGKMLQPQWSAAPPSIMIALMLQFAIVIASFMAWPIHGSLIDIAYGARFLALFLLFNLIPFFIAWASESTAIDFIVYLLCACILGFLSVLAAAARTLVRLVGLGGVRDSSRRPAQMRMPGADSHAL
jgi:hypothetical protein